MTQKARALQDIWPEVACRSLPSHFEKLQVTAISQHLSSVKPGHVFVTWQGQKSDGHRYTLDALARGAVLVVGEDLPGILAKKLGVEKAPETYMAVSDARLFLAQLAERFYGFPSEKFCLIGFTGTNGKTSSSYLLYQILLKAQSKAAYVGTLGMMVDRQPVSSHMTTPDIIPLLDSLTIHQSLQHVVMEVSSQALHQQRVKALSFDIAVFLNLTQDHLDYHGDMQHYFLAKLLLLQHLKPSACVVFNLDDPYMATLPQYFKDVFQQLTKGNLRLLAFSQKGLLPPNRVGMPVKLLEPSKHDAQGLILKLLYGEELLLLQVPLHGLFQVENILAVCTVCWALQLKGELVQHALSEVMIPGRMQAIHLPDTQVIPKSRPQVFVDYAHTPAALTQALGSLRSFTSGKLFCVFGCGGNRDSCKRSLMGEIAMRFADVVVLTNDNPRHESAMVIAQQIEVGLKKAGKDLHSDNPQPVYQIILDRHEAINWAISQANAQDVVLIAGKGHETYQQIAEIKQPFDDRLVAEQALICYHR